MAHWFHRSAFKATADQKFELKMFSIEAQAVKLCSDLRQSRARLLHLLPDANHEPETIQTALDSYLSILVGIITAPVGDEKGGTSKLRLAIPFKWTQTMHGNTPQTQNDAQWELINMTFNVAIWFMKHASRVAGKDDITMEEAKVVHKSLRRAAGLFEFSEKQASQLLEPPQAGADVDPLILAAYINQCTAEAQEVTIARAIEMKHNPSLISALANETAKMFRAASDALASIDLKKVGHWRKYLQLKCAFYMSHAYNYCGENYLAQDKCGDAIRALQESEKYFEYAREFCREYGSYKDHSSVAKPDKHAFFQRFYPVLKRTLEKCERENGFIYHQKVPADPPELEMRATYGLVSPEGYELPTPCPLWTDLAYSAFDMSQMKPKEDGKKSEKRKSEEKEKDLPPVKEAPVHQSDKDPKTSSGCVLS